MMGGDGDCEGMLMTHKCVCVWRRFCLTCDVWGFVGCFRITVRKFVFFEVYVLDCPDGLKGDGSAQEALGAQPSEQPPSPSGGPEDADEDEEDDHDVSSRPQSSRKRRGRAVQYNASIDQVTWLSNLIHEISDQPQPGQPAATSQSASALEVAQALVQDAFEMTDSSTKPPCPHDVQDELEMSEQAFTREIEQVGFCQKYFVDIKA